MVGLLEDVGGSLEHGGCSFMNQVGTVKENRDRLPSLPVHSKITLCSFERSKKAWNLLMQIDLVLFLSRFLFEIMRISVLLEVLYCFQYLGSY